MSIFDPDDEIESQCVYKTFNKKSYIINTFDESAPKSIDVFSESSIGGRKTQEDSIVFCSRLIPGTDDSFFFGLFDGTVSGFASEHIKSLVLPHLIASPIWQSVVELVRKSNEKREQLLNQSENQSENAAAVSTPGSSSTANEWRIQMIEEAVSVQCLDTILDRELPLLLGKALDWACLQADLELMSLCTEANELFSCCTAVLLVIIGPFIAVAHLGDSRAAIGSVTRCSNSSGIALSQALSPGGVGVGRSGPSQAGPTGHSVAQGPDRLDPSMFGPLRTGLGDQVIAQGLDGLHPGRSRPCSGPKKPAPSPPHSRVTGIFLTQDHKPDDVDESRRITKFGGSVEYLPNHSYRAFLRGGDFSIRKAQGLQAMQLQYSRAFGGVNLKAFGLSSEPDLRVLRLRPMIDRYLIVASDGLWDHLSASEAVNIVEESSYSDPAAELVRIGIGRARDVGVQPDNTTVCVFVFHY